MKLKWNKPAREALAKAIDYIDDSSFVAADKVLHRIQAKTQALTLHPAKYPQDRMKRNNDGSFRAFTSDGLRISYRVFKDSIHILRVRHAKRKPLGY